MEPPVSSGCSSRYFFATYPHGGDEKYKHSKVPNENLRTMPVTKKESARARKIKSVADKVKSPHSK